MDIPGTGGCRPSCRRGDVAAAVVVVVAGGGGGRERGGPGRLASATTWAVEAGAGGRAEAVGTCGGLPGGPRGAWAPGRPWRRRWEKNPLLPLSSSSSRHRRCRLSWSVSPPPAKEECQNISGSVYLPKQNFVSCFVLCSFCFVFTTFLLNK